MNIFIGSSEEKEGVMQSIAVIIENAGATPRRWNDNDNPIFSVGEYTLESLTKVIDNRDVDAAVFIFAEDDKKWYRGERVGVPRDNVIFEAGLFTSVLGCKKAIIIRTENAKLPTDFNGVTIINYHKKEQAKQKIEKWVKELLEQKKEKVSATKTQQTSTSPVTFNSDGYCSFSLKPELETVIASNILNNSELKYLFLNVTDCKETRKAIKEYFNNKNIENSFCGLYDLYGRADVLLKYRYPDSLRDEIHENLKNHNLLTHKHKKAKEVAIEEEKYDWLNKDNTKYYLWKDASQYPQSAWNSSFLRAFLIPRDRSCEPDVSGFFNEIEDLIKSRKCENIKEIVRSVCIEKGGESVIFDLLLSCRNFPLLHKLTDCVEDVLTEIGTDKYTHIVYHHEEYRI